MLPGLRRLVNPAAPCKAGREIGRERGAEPQNIARARVRKLQFGSMQELPRRPARQLGRPGTITARETALPPRGVRRVSHDRVPDVQQVDADLVRAPGVQARAQEVRRSPLLHTLELRSRRSTAGVHNRHAFAVSRIATNGSVYRQRVARQVPPARGKVFPPNCTAPKLVRERAVRQVVLGNEHQAGGVAIQAVNDPGTQHAADPGQIADSVQQCMHESAGGMSGGRMYHETGWLVDHQEVPILENDLQRNSFRHQLGRLGRGQPHRDSVSGAWKVPLARGRVVDGDLAAFYQGGNAASGQVQAFGEKGVESDALIRLHGDANYLIRLRH